MDEDERKLIRDLHLLTIKPVLYVCNVAEDGIHDADNNPHVQAVRKQAAEEGAQVVVISAKVEAEIAELEGEDKQMFLEELGLKESGLDRLIRAAYDLLGLITYFTAGVQEVRAWTIRKGTKAPQAAGVIHSDFERGFIRAEVISYDDLVEAGSVAAAREKGKYRLEGKEYVVQDGDVMHFRFNV
jgi:GTP-binding protein YchF